MLDTNSLFFFQIYISKKLPKLRKNRLRILFLKYAQPARMVEQNKRTAKLLRFKEMAQGYHNFDNLRAAILFFNVNLSLFHTIDV